MPVLYSRRLDSRADGAAMNSASTFSTRLPAFAVAALIVAACATTAGAQTPSPTPSIPSIVTVGEAILRRAPDRAYVTASVESRARNPQDAQRQNAEAMAAVQAALRNAGIPEQAIRTLGYSIRQEVDFVNGRRVPRDYLATNGVEVRLDNVERTGEILGLVVEAGATSVGGVRFDLQDRAGAEREAVRLAVEDARARAQAMAEGAGRSLGDILRIEDTVQPPGLPRPMTMARMAQDAVEAVDVPVAAGEIEIHAQVTLTVEIR